MNNVCIDEGIEIFNLKNGSFLSKLNKFFCKESVKKNVKLKLNLKQNSIFGFDNSIQSLALSVRTTLIKNRQINHVERPINVK